MLWDLIQWSVLRKAFIYKQIPLNLAWDQVPHCGEKGEKVGVGEKNKIDERSEPRGSLGSGKGGRPSPLTRIPLGSLCSPIFFLFDPFLFSLFFPHCGAWSQASLDQFFKEVCQRLYLNIGAYQVKLFFSRRWSSFSCYGKASINFNVVAWVLSDSSLFFWHRVWFVTQLF